MPALVAELVRRQVALIGAFGPPAAQAAKAATTTIPIVFTSTDPVKYGLVASLNRPGGNATGVHVITADLEGKRLELLGELVSASAPIAVLINPKGDYAERQAKDLQAGAHRIGRQILILNASSERDIVLRLGHWSQGGSQRSWSQLIRSSIADVSSWSCSRRIMPSLQSINGASLPLPVGL